MKKYIHVAIVTLVFITGCGTTKRASRVETSTTITEQVEIGRSTEIAQHTTGKTVETESSESGSERVTTVTETTTTTEFSAPDSFGNQHKVRETTTLRHTGETERKGQIGQKQKQVNMTSDIAISDSLHVETSTESVNASFSIVETERKSGFSDYLWAFGFGAAAVIAAGIGIWLWRKKRSLRIL